MDLRTKNRNSKSYLNFKSHHIFQIFWKWRNREFYFKAREGHNGASTKGKEYKFSLKSLHRAKVNDYEIKFKNTNHMHYTKFIFAYVSLFQDTDHSLITFESDLLFFMISFCIHEFPTLIPSVKDKFIINYPFSDVQDASFKPFLELLVAQGLGIPVITLMLEGGTDALNEVSQTELNNSYNIFAEVYV